jgi:phosphate-selective porin OprO/OprP
MERSYVDQTVPAKKVGLQVMGSPKAGFTYALSTFQPNDTELNVAGGNRASGAARGTINFAEIMGNKEAIMHIGLAGLDENFTIGTASSSQTDAAASATNRGTISSFRTSGRGLNNAFRGQVGGTACATASYSCASEFSASVTHKAYGLEGIYATGPFRFVGEYSAGDYKGTQGASSTSYDTKTYYVEAGYFVTGEKYASSYKNGVFSSFKPNNDFDIDKGNWGAVELLARVEGFDVENIAFTGSNGRVQGSVNGSATGSTEAGAKTYTGGIRWILNPNVVIKANYSYTKFDYDFAPIDVAGATAIVKDEKLLMFRTQYMF